MHHDAGTPHWKLIQIQKFQKSLGGLDRQMNGQTDRRTDGQTYYTATHGIYLQRVWFRSRRLYVG